MSRDSGTVSEAERQRFCDECVSAEFPDGYTVIGVVDCWKPGDEDTPATCAKIRTSS